MSALSRTRFAESTRSAVQTGAFSVWASAGLLAAAAAIVYAVFWPGIINWDTTQIISGAERGPAIDWWTGLGTLILREWFALGLGTGVLWALGVAANVIGLYGCLRVVAGRITAAAITLIIVAFPPVYGELSSFSRDTAYLGLTLIAVAALGRGAKKTARDSRGWFVLAVLCALMASVCRQNGVVDVAAVVLFSVLHRENATHRGRVLRVIAACAIAAVSYASIGLVQRADGIESTYASRATFVYDLAAISVNSGHDDLPRRALAQLGPGTAAPPDTSLLWLRQNFNPWDESSLTGVSRMNVTDTRLDSKEYQILRAAWLHAVTKHPIDYLLARAGLSLRLLGLQGPPATGPDALLTFSPPASPSNDGRPLAYPRRYAQAAAWLRNFLGSNARIPLDRSWMYILLLLVSWTFVRRTKAEGRIVVDTLGLAVVLNQALLFFVAPSASARYDFLVIPAALLAAAFAVAGVVAGASAEHREGTARPV